MKGGAAELTQTSNESTSAGPPKGNHVTFLNLGSFRVNSTNFYKSSQVSASNIAQQIPKITLVSIMKACQILGKNAIQNRKFERLYLQKYSELQPRILHAFIILTVNQVILGIFWAILETDTWEPLVELTRNDPLYG